MIHYHGSPTTPLQPALALYQRRHAMVSFANPEQLPLVAEVCQSFVLDNGAFTFWKAGRGTVDVEAYRAWVAEWERHPGFDWALIPDKIDGDEAENDIMLARWFQAGGGLDGVPVWHLHERLERLRYMAIAYPRVALGSSGVYSEPNTPAWWKRMAEAMDAVCDQGRPRVKLHGLRMLNPAVFGKLPLASADSTAVARNIGLDVKWAKGQYQPMTKTARALVLVDRIEHFNSAANWTERETQTSFDLTSEVA